MESTMADEVDITTEREEMNIANAIRAAHQDSGPQPTGACHWCDEPVGPTDRWCSLECKVDWERDFTLRKKVGLR